jgi:hypothetical protein
MGGWSMQRLAAVLLDEQVATDPAHTAAEIEEGLAYIALDAVVPGNLEDVPVATIIKARRALHSNRLAFQEALRKIVEEEAWLQGVTDPDALQVHLNLLYENKLKVHLDQMERDLGLLGVPARRGLITVLAKAPSWGLAAAKAFGWVIHPAVPVAAHVAGAIIRRLRPKQASQTIGSTQAVAYLLKVRETLTPRGMAEEMLARTKRAVVSVATGLGTTEMEHEREHPEVEGERGHETTSGEASGHSQDGE